MRLTFALAVFLFSWWVGITFPSEYLSEEDQLELQEFCDSLDQEDEAWDEQQETPQFLLSEEKEEYQ